MPLGTFVGALNVVWHRSSCLPVALIGRRSGIYLVSPSPPVPTDDALYDSQIYDL